MIVFTTIRDFAAGLGRGLSLFLTERQDVTEQALFPSLAPRSKAR